MSGLYSDIEVKLAEVLLEYPEKKTDPVGLFEEVSGVKVGDGTIVHLHSTLDGDYVIALPPSPDEVKGMIERNESLGSFFKSMFIDPQDENLSTAKPQQVIAGLVWTDKGYLEKLKSAPRESLNSILDEKFPQEINVSVFEDSVDNIHLNVPPQVTGNQTGALEESQLEQVTGGIAPVVAAAVITGGFAVAAAVAKNPHITNKIIDGVKGLFD